ncbi:MAG: PEP-CTERM sorting domain-containing protein [Planctomycetota bacterium]
MKNQVLAVFALVAGCAGSSQADILWNQSAIDVGPNGVGVPNSVSPGFNGWTAFAVEDVSVGAGGWTINSVSTYFSALSWNPGSVTSAVLNVFSKSGNSPIAANNPRANPTGQGSLVTVTMNGMDVAGNGVWEIRADGLNINLSAGEYWIGLTPVGPTGPFGPDRQWSSTSHYGQSQHVRFYPDSGWQNGGSFYGVPSFDGAILIEGVNVPAPASLGLIGLGGLLATRRRR